MRSHNRVRAASWCFLCVAESYDERVHLPEYTIRPSYFSDDFFSRYTFNSLRSAPSSSSVSEFMQPASCRSACRASFSRCCFFWCSSRIVTISPCPCLRAMSIGLSPGGIRSSCGLRSAASRSRACAAAVLCSMSSPQPNMLAASFEDPRVELLAVLEVEVFAALLPLLFAAFILCANSRNSLLFGLSAIKALASASAAV
mmetsp:Transcript_22222/g.56054  ORF Transcript_22222/g.56054 Transcript_22222/m.56054 type:complete len:200 (+) Transcript_22222:145-744(+)